MSITTSNCSSVIFNKLSVLKNACIIDKNLNFTKILHYRNKPRVTVMNPKYPLYKK